jgi:hypothetical protein
MLIALFSLFLSVAQAKPIIVAVLDTGLKYNELSAKAHLCQYGHKDFTQEQNYESQFNTKDPVPRDILEHGTNVAGIIDTYASKTGKEFCIVILKIFTYRNRENSIQYSVAAIKYARQIHANIINYSAGGGQANKDEREEVSRFIKSGGKFVAAAGNEKNDLLRIPYYPACYKNVIIVGNMGKNLFPVASSNYGSLVKRWEYGEMVKGFGIELTGTSQATAVATGKIVGELKQNMIEAIKELHYKK